MRDCGRRGFEKGSRTRAAVCEVRDEMSRYRFTYAPYLEIISKYISRDIYSRAGDARPWRLYRNMSLIPRGAGRVVNRPGRDPNQCRSGVRPGIACACRTASGTLPQHRARGCWRAPPSAPCRPARPPPSGGAEAPAVARARPGKPYSGRGVERSLPRCAREVEELGGHPDADGVPAAVLGAGVAAAVAEEAGQRVERAGLQRLAQDVEALVEFDAHRDPPPLSAVGRPMPRRVLRPGGGGVHHRRTRSRCRCGAADCCGRRRGKLLYRRPCPTIPPPDRPARRDPRADLCRRGGAGAGAGRARRASTPAGRAAIVGAGGRAGRAGARARRRRR